MIIAAVVLIFAVAGTAIAGPDAISRAVTKSKVKKIAKKQAKKVFKQRAGELAGATGPQGPQGVAGAEGAQGAQGPPGEATAGSVVTTEAIGTRVLLDPRTGADVRLGSSSGFVTIVNSDASLPLQAAGTLVSGTNALEEQFETIAPGASATFSYMATLPPNYLDLMLVVSGPDASQTRRSHLSCSAVNGSSGRPSTLSCIAAG